jgi:hypothetical protein
LFLQEESFFEGLFNFSFFKPLIFVVNAQVAVLADALGVQRPLMVRTFGCFLGPALGMIAVFAHAVSIVLLAGVVALGDLMLMDA